MISPGTWAGSHLTIVERGRQRHRAELYVPRLKLSAAIGCKLTDLLTVFNGIDLSALLEK